MRTDEPMEGAREAGEAVAGEKKRTIAREVLGVARALDAAAEELRRQEQDAMAGMTSRAAETARGLGRDLEGKGFKELLRELEQLGREQPALVTAGAALAGFLAARVARESGDSETEEDFETEELEELEVEAEVQETAEPEEIHGAGI
jgi:hypothetical protein